MKYTIACIQCGHWTSKAYAAKNSGKCKTCVTGVESKSNMLCPDCGTNYLSPYQKKNHYHCDQCTKDADPIGYYNEVMGYNDGPDY